MIHCTLCLSSHWLRTNGKFSSWELHLLYKHQWNTRWAFARKLDIFTSEYNMLSSHVKISPLLWLHNKSRLSHQKTIKVKCFGLSLVFRAVFSWLSKGIGFGFGFGFTTPFGWLVYLLWFWFYDSQVKTALYNK